MGRITESFKDQIKDRVKISDIAGKHVKLKRSGRELVGLSPFTNEKSPSFFVMDEKRLFHCFSSGKNGDVISLIMELENLRFMEAIQTLAEMAGLEMPKYTPEEEKKDERRARAFEALRKAQEYFEAQLYTDAGKIARNYLESRGLGKKSASEWGLGFAPAGFQTIPKALNAMPREALIDAGLIKESARGDMGFFRNRLTIPVRNRTGQVVSFSARALDPDGKPKYLNGPATMAFDKSRTLFGAEKAKDGIRKTKDAHGLILAEGCMDVIALWRGGFDVGVAPLGTAITTDHIKELWRYGVEPTICLDGDAAGKKAAMRVADIALPILDGRNTVNFAIMPAGMDPDDVLRRKGADALKGLILNPVPLSRYIWEHERDQEKLSSPEARSGFKTRLDAHLGKIHNSDIKGHFRSAFYQWTRAHYQRGHRSRGQTLKAGAVIGHRGIGILARCIDNPNLFSANDEALGLAKLGREGALIYEAALAIYMADQPITREAVIDSLLAEMHNEAAAALQSLPVTPEIRSGSPAWNEMLKAIADLGRAEYMPKSLAEAMDARS